jgi:PPK2 family polyphosphate:nucleotide phosphotransferase
MDRYRVTPGQRVNLDEWDPDDKGEFIDKADGRAALSQLTDQLEALQELLYAQQQHKLLIVLQALDTGGKDGTIRHVFDGVNPQGISVVSFKAPTAQELSHDYLWRIHKKTPARGEITIFNRSHYEDVLIVRVHNLVPEAVWSRRYDHINAFERMLADEGVTIRKFYLHISKEEQRKRLQTRLNQPAKRWKFNQADLNERKLWDDYRAAYEAMLSKTSTEWALWYVVPANRKWYRNWVVSSILVETLNGLSMHYPQPPAGLEEIVIE